MLIRKLIGIAVLIFVIIQSGQANASPAYNLFSPSAGTQSLTDWLSR